jgi:hypothetical protein
MKGVWFDWRLADAIRDEAPSAYEDIRAVLKEQHDLVKECGIQCASDRSSKIKILKSVAPHRRCVLWRNASINIHGVTTHRWMLAASQG